jgi:hypothetical protein
MEYLKPKKAISRYCPFNSSASKIVVGSVVYHSQNHYMSERE